MLIRFPFIAISLLVSRIALAQSWHPAVTASFEVIAAAEDGSILLVRYPGDILRSTDAGGTWSVVYRGGFRIWCIGCRGGAIWAYGDSSDAVVSYDSGLSWHEAPPPSPLPLRSASEEGEYDSALHPIPHTLYPLPKGTNAVSYADSAWWAVGEPGLICQWDGRRWRELHRAPFRDEPEPPPGPLLEKEGERDSGKARIAFSSAAHGAVTVGNQIYFTNDSATMWSETLLPDTSSITSFFLLSDTTTLIGMQDGRLYYDSSQVFTRCDSILNSGEGWGTQPLQNRHPILSIGWKDKLNGYLYVLTDSPLYSVSVDLHSATIYSPTLRMGERAVAASFPDAYTGYVLTDSVQRRDTLTSDGRDTTLVLDTSYIYRSLDGGSTWNIVLKNIPGLTNLNFLTAKTGFACGANGLILHTEDSGSHWSRAWTMTRQTLHDLQFVNDAVGYAVGDSGVVLITQTSGRLWRALPPEPLFTHPATAYTSIAFPDVHTVYVVAQDRCYRATIPDPMIWHPHWHLPERHTLSISESPNPSRGPVELTIRGNPKDGSVPALTICDLNGNVITRISTLEAIALNEWHASIDLSSLPVNVYAAVVRLGGEEAMSKFLIEH